MVSVVSLCLLPSRAALLTLDNGTVRVGVDTALGGSITYLSPSGSTTNLINSYDLGRQVQQSYYSGPADFHPAGTTQHRSWSPWPWNPIQTGDAFGNRATVLESASTGDTLYVKTRPMQWALQNVPGDCTFEWWIRLEGAAVRVHCRLTSQRTDTTQYGARHQELPAVYGVGTLNRIFSYTGTAPFTRGAVSQLPSVGPPWTQWRATENWSALVDAADFGIGVHHPDAIYTTGGYASSGNAGTGGPTSFNTGYIAPIHSELLDANLVYEYDFNLILGTLESIRSWVYAHAGDHRPAWRFATTRGHWAPNLGDGGPPEGFLRQKLGPDPQLTGPYCAFPAGEVNTVFFSARYIIASPPTRPSAQLFWETNNAGGFTGTRSLSIPVNASGDWRIYSFPVGGSAEWAGLVSQLRLDAIQSAGTGDTVDLGGISWKNDPPVISALSDLTMAFGAAPLGVEFSVSDDLVPADAVVVTASSSNQVLLPNSGLRTSGSGANRVLTLTPVANQAGTTTVTVTATDSVATSTRSFTLTVSASPNPGRLVNLSVLSTVTAADPLFTLGVVVGGAGTAGSKPLLLRAVGPALASFGVTGALADPALQFFSGETVIAANDNWGGGAAQSAAFTAVGAFAYATPTSKDAAIFAEAVPAGNYTLQVRGVSGATGTVLAELYDATPASALSSQVPRLINLSVLKQIGAGELLTAGFVIGGTTTKQILVRAVGPRLGAAPFNLSGVLADPKVDLFSGQRLAATNDNWGTQAGVDAATASQLTAVFTQVGAFALAAGSRDAALLATLAPGSYSAQVSGVAGTGGLALVEVYEVQ